VQENALSLPEVGAFKSEKKIVQQTNKYKTKKVERSQHHRHHDSQSVSQSQNKLKVNCEKLKENSVSCDMQYASSVASPSWSCLLHFGLFTMEIYSFTLLVSPQCIHVCKTNCVLCGIAKLPGKFYSRNSSYVWHVHHSQSPFYHGHHSSTAIY